MSAEVDITMATEDDLPIILAFIKGLAEYERLPHECVATIDKLRNTLFSERPAAEVLIARLDGEAVGFALFFQSYSTFLAQPGFYLEDLFVDPPARGKGIGRALLTALARLAVDRDYGRIEWSVLNWNESAIGFYRSIGARPLDEWTTFRMSGSALQDLARNPAA
jgi:GNAT superfamily N-acetyltransferase